MERDPYKYFSGEKHFQYPLNERRDVSKPNRYKDPDIGEFYFNPITNRITSGDGRTYIQIFNLVDFGDPIEAYILYIDSTSIQIEIERNGRYKRIDIGEDGLYTHFIKCIGKEFIYNTTTRDRSSKCKRPWGERHQIITSAGKFKSHEQQKPCTAFLENNSI